MVEDRGRIGCVVRYVVVIIRVDDIKYNYSNHNKTVSDKSSFCMTITHGIAVAVLIYI